MGYAGRCAKIHTARTILGVIGGVWWGSMGYSAPTVRQIGVSSASFEP
jgi:hypothetical protein